MPAEDVSDLRDVVDAINRLCDTMKASEVEEPLDVEPGPGDEIPWSESTSRMSPPGRIEDADVVVQSELVGDIYEYYAASSEVSSPGRSVVAEKIASNAKIVREMYYTEETPPERQEDAETIASEADIVARSEFVGELYYTASSEVSQSGRPEDAETIASDVELVARSEFVSEMYYTASSEVSLLSDETPERPVEEDPNESRDERRECAIAGHVAAMRERFESMTRANTPCPDLIRSTSPSLDVFRNITPSPDRLG